MSTRRISTLMLEQYHLGELGPEARELVRSELAANTELRLRYQGLEDSDRELRQRYPTLSNFRMFSVISPRRKRYAPSNILKGLCAAALFIFVLFPSLYFIRARNSNTEAGFDIMESSGDRIKGTEIKTELSIYLKENPLLSSVNEGLKLPDQTLLMEGNTVQLAYTTPPGAVYYGVIFSIDGRSVVTMHYPYRRGQSPILTAGKRTFLDEAYTLDDAPGFEMFFMVVSQDPLDTEGVLRTAVELAQDQKTVFTKISSAFGNCEVETITIRK